MHITELTTYDNSLVDEIDSLIRGLGEDSNATKERIRATIDSRDSHLYMIVERDDLLGCATLCVGRTPELVLGFVEAVVVKEECRGQGLGRKMMEYIVSEARKLGVMELHLTSNPRREAANAMYQNLGFVRKETNVYLMRLQ